MKVNLGVLYIRKLKQFCVYGAIPLCVPTPPSPHLGGGHHELCAVGQQQVRHLPVVTRLVVGVLLVDTRGVVQRRLSRVILRSRGRN